MSRALVLSNGSLCVTLDHTGMVRDIYYPHVGLENHVRGHYAHRVGVWIEGRLSWVSDNEWQVEVRCDDDALASAIVAKHEGLEIELVFADTVCESHDTFLRSVVVINHASRARDIKLYFNHEFEIQKMHGSDTAYFDPRAHAIVHYKGHRVFAIGASLDGVPFTEYATGRARFQGREGSFKDAEDGVLSMNPVEHGPADSVIGLYAEYEAHEKKTCEYWLIAAQSIAEALQGCAVIEQQTPERMRRASYRAWHRWLRRLEPDFLDLDERHQKLFRRSLMFARAHADHDGGIIASVDSDMFQYGLDTYSYVWMRDSAYVVLALDAAGDTDIARKFFEFCRRVITKDGYFMHKYLPDASLGSSWHPWIVNGKKQLPIQEDETAIVMFALAAYVRRHDDDAFLEEYFESLVEQPANFLLTYRSIDGLPDASYDLWERKRGISTYTASTVFGALIAAAELAERLGKDALAKKYHEAAHEVQKGIRKHLWKQPHVPYNMVVETEGKFVPDPTIDISSVYGLFYFAVVPAEDDQLRVAFAETVRALSEGIEIGGLARFTSDDYYHSPNPATGNPWYLTTLWYAEYLIATARTVKDLKKAHDILDWVADHALPSGVLSEQLDPISGAQVSAGPLAWSHSTYVYAILKYLEKKRQLSA